MVVPHICFLNPKASQAEGTQSWPISIRAPGRCPGALPCQSWHRAGAPSPCGRRCWAHAHWGCRREAMGLRVRASDKCVIPGVRWNGSSSLLRESPILPSLLSICGSSVHMISCYSLNLDLKLMSVPRTFSWGDVNRICWFKMNVSP